MPQNLLRHHAQCTADSFQQTNQIIGLVFGPLTEASEIAEHHSYIALTGLEQRCIEFVA